MEATRGNGYAPVRGTPAMMMIQRTHSRNARPFRNFSTQLAQATQRPKRKDRSGLYSYVACVAWDGNEALEIYHEASIFLSNSGSWFNVGHDALPRQ